MGQGKRLNAYGLRKATLIRATAIVRRAKYVWVRRTNDDSEGLINECRALMHNPAIGATFAPQVSRADFSLLVQ
jgi:hypothetical protein